MASNLGLKLTPQTWVLGTSSDAVNVSFQNVGACNVRVAYTNGTTPPTGYEGVEYGWRPVQRQGEPLGTVASKTTVSGANRVWFMALGEDGRVNVEWN